MQVTCPKCSARIPAEDVNIARVVAKCRSCGAVFNFEGQLALPRATASSPIARVALPPGIDLQISEHPAPAPADPYRAGTRAAGDLTLTRRWFNAGAIFLLLFSIVWFSFLAFWYTTAFTDGAPWIVFVFPILHVGAGFMIAHKALTGLLNTTTIRVANGRLTVRHGPIPTFGDRDIALFDLRQLYTVTKTRSKGADTYELHAITSVGPTVKLMTDLTEVQQALYIERTIEDHLGIEDDSTANQRT
jgi:predicted Zn finger-like uncharacterized protein